MDTKQNVISIISLIFLGLMAFAFIKDCSHSSNNTDYSKPSYTSEPATPVLTVSNVTTENEGYGYWSIVGMAHNNTSKTLSYAEVNYNVYDDNDNQVGTAMTNINNLEPGGNWHFKAVVTEKAATKYKLKEAIGW